MSIEGDAKVANLRQKIEELKYQYDQYFSGNRRTEPAMLLNDLEREILATTKLMATDSTMVKFQLQSLAHKFRSFQTQVKKLLERRDTARVKASTQSAGKAEEISLYIDKVAINNPSILDKKIRQMCEKGGVGNLNADQISKTLMAKAAQVIDKPNVAAVKFSMVKGENGPKLKGDIVSRKSTT